MRQRELATLFDFNYWAHRRILTTAARLIDPQLTLRSVIVGRDLRATLVHTLGVEFNWCLRLQRRPEEECGKAVSIPEYRPVAGLGHDCKGDWAEKRPLVGT